MPNADYSIVEQVFQKVASECSRSETKLDLHSNQSKDLCLAALLEQVRLNFGQNIADSFQRQYEHQQRELSFLFAQVTNAALERAFHQGRCGAQAIYALFELYKVGVFTATMVWSRTYNPNTEHYYLIIPDEYGFARLNETKELLLRIGRKNNRPIFGEESIFFDPWSKELRRWKEFSPEQWVQFISQNDYAKGLSQADQGLFKPPMLLFNADEVTLLEKIVWCLSEYKKRILALPPKNFATLQQIPQLAPLLELDIFQNSDPAFDAEVVLLTNSDKCKEMLLESIEKYLSEFSQLLEEKYRSRSDATSNQLSVAAKDQWLMSSTNLFFGFHNKSTWRKYPENKLSGSYAGHQVRFFNMPDTSKQDAHQLELYLKNLGFFVQIRTVNDNPSAFVDLDQSISSPTLEMA